MRIANYAKNFFKKKKKSLFLDRDGHWAARTKMFELAHSIRTYIFIFI